jgi:hypothetical protein
MAIPDVSINVKDGGLGIVDASADRLHVKVGASSLGTVNSPMVVADLDTLTAAFGTGPVVEAAAVALSEAGAGQVMVVKAPSSGGGTVTAVAKTGTGLSVLTVSGTALDAYDVRVEVLQAAANPAAGTATFRYSLDGGRTYSAELAVPTSGSYAVPGTGLSLTFSAASLAVGDVHTFTSTQPSYTVTEMGAAVDAALGAVEEFSFIHIVGPPVDAPATAALVAALDSKLSLAANNHRYVRGLVEAPDVADATLAAGMAATATTRIGLAGGYASVVSPLNQVAAKRPAAWVVAARAGAVLPYEDLARVRSGPLTGVVSLFRDERKTPALDAARITSLRTFIRRPGFFITNARLLATPGSDFEFWQHGRLMDVASATVYAGLVEYLSDTIAVDRTTGKLLEVDARAMEAALESRVRARLVDGTRQVSAITVAVPRTQNVLSTKTLSASVRIVPLGYLKQLRADISYFNPAITTAAA